MSETERIAQIFNNWKELSLNEGRGIQAGNWTRVIECQDGKRRLMAQLDNVRKNFTGDFSLFPEAGELVNLELQNAEWLGEAREKARIKKNNLNRSARDLKKVHSAYLRPVEPNWTSFS